jgi:hypothetical protein
MKIDLKEHEPNISSSECTNKKSNCVTLFLSEVNKKIFAHKIFSTPSMKKKGWTLKVTKTFRDNDFSWKKKNSPETKQIEKNNKTTFRFPFAIFRS